MATKKELLEQVQGMSEEEAAQVRIVFAPEWPSKRTSIAEIRQQTGTRAMTPAESEAFWSEHRAQMQPADGEG